VAPFRAARSDGELLWTAGYRQARVRRKDGLVENLESFLYAYRKADLARGVLAPVHAVDLAAERLTDPVAVAPGATGILVALSGSHRLVRVDSGSHSVPAGPAVAARPSAFVTSDVLAEGAWIFTVGLLDDALYVHRQSDLGLVETVPLSAEPAPEPQPAPATDYALGEVLFYSKALWADTPSNQFTCNGCHWEGGSDHRVHPGFRESRWELGRPAAGVGMLSPIFTPGQASSITAAVNGFVRALDERYWTEREAGAWLEPVEVEIAPGRRALLSPHDVRRALLTYLARQPVEPGFLRAPGQPFSESALRGAALFWRDCARCHEPSPHMAAAAALGRDAALDHLIERPLAFGAARWEQTGVLPYFTERGNRVSPLTQLGRGGPFFSNGSARTLAEVVQRTDPGRSLVHAPENAGAPFYQPDQAQDLIDFLLSI
jgi:mono/diheme cytochrome c family protein